MSKVPLVLFSGGLDSTYLLYQHATNKETVDILYANAGQGQNKINAELEARRKIINALEDHFNRRVVVKTLNSGYEINTANLVKAAFRQPLAWLYEALRFADPERHSCVEIGYVMGDQISSNLEDLITAWNALWKVTKNCELVPLTFPLRWVSKQTIMKEITKEIYKLTWVCELPDEDGNPCNNTCVACITRKTEEYRYSLINNRDYFWDENDNDKEEVKEDKGPNAIIADIHAANYDRKIIDGQPVPKEVPPPPLQIAEGTY